jgi:hypothetical protein
MSPKKIKNTRFLIAFSSLTLFFSFFAYTVLKAQTATTEPDELNKQMESLKADIEQPNSSPALMKRYQRLAFALSKCNYVNQLAGENYFDNLTPTASLCINGALALSDPDFNRPLASSTGTGIGNGTAGNCSLSGTATASNYDSYSFNLSSCAIFPTAVDISLCGPAGCAAPQVVDTMLVLYRNVAAGDPLTANGGLPGVFNPASPCTNARAGNDDSGATPTSPGGSTCSQTGSCLPQCGTSTALSEMRRNLGDGRFTVVVSGFGNTTVGTYNLYVNAPAAGCALALAPSAANAGISGRVLTGSGQGIRNAAVMLTGGAIQSPIIKYTTTFGSYSFENLPVGENYVVTVMAKRYSFENSSQVFNLTDSITDADFISADK